MPAAATRLVLIRHGESRAQVAGLISGHDTCRGLSDLGRRQAAALRDRLGATGELADVAAVYTSLLPRAIETAAILQPSIGGVPARRECAWCEIHAGPAEGMTPQELRDRHPVVGDHDDPFRHRLPGMETWAELYVRVGARLTRAADEHAGETVVIVAHGGTIGASFVALGDVPIRQGIALVRDARNTSITEWCGDGTTWRLVRANDAAHLDDLGTG